MKNKITAENLEEAFDAGVDVTEYFDTKNAIRPSLDTKRVNVDFPEWVVSELDQEAKRVGVTRQAIIKIWIVDRIRKEAAPLSA